MVDAAFAHALDVFGADDSKNEARYCASGVKTASNTQIRAIFVDLMRADLDALGLKTPDVSRGVRGSYRTA